MTNRINLQLWAAAKTRQLNGDERGANLVEYALLVAFIAIVCVGAVALLGGQTGEPLSELGSSLRN